MPGFGTPQPKEYLGDSVYAELTPDGLTLTTENGDGPTNTIFLEPQVIDRMIKLFERAAREAVAAEAAARMQRPFNTES